jgi:predicted proteasome-type protease
MLKYLAPAVENHDGFILRESQLEDIFFTAIKQNWQSGYLRSLFADLEKHGHQIIPSFALSIENTKNGFGSF